MDSDRNVSCRGANLQWVGGVQHADPSNPNTWPKGCPRGQVLTEELFEALSVRRICTVAAARPRNTATDDSRELPKIPNPYPVAYMKQYKPRQS